MHRGFACNCPLAFGCWSCCLLTAAASLTSMPSQPFFLGGGECLCDPQLSISKIVVAFLRVIICIWFRMSHGAYDRKSGQGGQINRMVIYCNKCPTTKSVSQGSFNRSDRAAGRALVIGNDHNFRVISYW